MSRLFKFTARLLVARPQKFFVQMPNAVQITGHRIVFSCRKQLKQNPNTCDLVVYNLAEQTRAEFEVRPLYVRLEAGFDGATERVFEGDMRWSESVQVETEWETRCQIHDGGRAFELANVARSYRAGVRVRDVVHDLTIAMEAAIDKTSASLLFGNEQFVSGVSTFGRASTQLTEVLRRSGKTWSIQDGRIQILGPSDHRLQQALLISERTGMIGQPEYGQPPAKKQPPLLKIKHVLIADLIPGQLIAIESKSHGGIFRAENAEHRGDSFGQTLETAIEAKRM